MFTGKEWQAARRAHEHFVKRMPHAIRREVRPASAIFHQPCKKTQITGSMKDREN